MSLPFHSNGSPIAVQKTPEILASQVVFGTPSRNCLGSGICKVYTLHGAKRLNIACEMVMAHLVLLDTQLQISFSIQACTEQLLQQHFSHPYFQVEEDFVLPTWLSRKLNSAAVFVPAGEYPILCKNDFIWLKLPLQLLYNPF